MARRAKTDDELMEDALNEGARGPSRSESDAAYRMPAEPAAVEPVGGAQSAADIWGPVLDQTFSKDQYGPRQAEFKSSLMYGLNDFAGQLAQQSAGVPDPHETVSSPNLHRNVQTLDERHAVAAGLDAYDSRNAAAAAAAIAPGSAAAANLNAPEAGGGSSPVSDLERMGWENTRRRAGSDAAGTAAQATASSEELASHLASSGQGMTQAELEAAHKAREEEMLRVMNESGPAPGSPGSRLAAETTGLPGSDKILGGRRYVYMADGSGYKDMGPADEQDKLNAAHIAAAKGEATREDLERIVHASLGGKGLTPAQMQSRVAELNAKQHVARMDDIMARGKLGNGPGGLKDFAEAFTFFANQPKDSANPGKGLVDGTVAAAQARQMFPSGRVGNQPVGPGVTTDARGNSRYADDDPDVQAYKEQLALAAAVKTAKALGVAVPGVYDPSKSGGVGRNKTGTKPLKGGSEDVLPTGEANKAKKKAEADDHEASVAVKGTTVELNKQKIAKDKADAQRLAESKSTQDAALVVMDKGLSSDVEILKAAAPFFAKIRPADKAEADAYRSKIIAWVKAKVKELKAR